MLSVRALFTEYGTEGAPVKAAQNVSFEVPQGSTFGLIGVAAAMTRPTADTLSPLPSIMGVAAGAGALRLLLGDPRAGRFNE